jgi:hypothetical protein
LYSRSRICQPFVPSRGGLLPASSHEIGVFVRASGQLRRARAAAKTAGAAAVELSDKIEMTQGRISIGIMHLAKGLEFRAVHLLVTGVDPACEFLVDVA